MDKKTLQNEILEKAYNQTRWLEVLRVYFGVTNLFEIPVAIKRQNDDWNKNVENASELGEFYTADERQIGIYHVKLTTNPKIKIKRIGLRNLFKQVYQQEVDAALIVFEQGNQWRFSFVSEIRTLEGKKETEPKRYTYLFGQGEVCRTAADNFEKLKGKHFTLSDLFEVFNVDKLNKDFFKSYKDFFERFSQHLSDSIQYRNALIGSNVVLEKGWKDPLAKPIRDFTKKLLGRIVFLHFLQKKRWMGVPAANSKWEGGDERFLKNLFYRYPHKEHFHSKALKLLFFNTLNHKRKNDLAPSELGENIRIPYLNGGLFDEDISSRINFDFPSGLFKDLLDFFEAYNFTIDENDPYDSEVGIDPEMLGHIFENLLEENREKGAFYTPKEIVHYMCQESIIQYLRTHLPECSEDEAPETQRLVEFVRTASIPSRDDKKDFIVKHARQIERLLDNVKICDPAIGSGAYPMGMLQEIYKLKSTLDLTLDEAKTKKAIIQKNIYGVDMENGAVEIARLRFWLALIVNEEEPEPLPNLDYKIMQGNSLLESFGGVDLSKLGEEDGEDIIYANKNQFELGVEFSAKRQSMLVFDKIEQEELYDLIDEYFEYDETKTSRYKNKDEIKRKISGIVEGKLLAKFFLDKNKTQAEIDRLEAELLSNTPDESDSKGIRDKKERNAKKINQQIKGLDKKLQNLETNLQKLKELEEKDFSKPYFLWHTWYKRDVFDKGGFDIVIGNPPYIQLQKDGGHFADLYETQNYKTFERTGDIYSLFYEHGVRLLSNKGILCYITSNKWMRTNYGMSTRQFFAQHTYPLILIDFGNIQVFETATVDTNILLLKNKPKAHKYDNIKTFAVRLDKDLNIKTNGLANYIQNNGYYATALNENSWIIGEGDIYDIKSSVEKQGVTLQKWNVRINYGLKTGLNKAFIIDEKTKQELIKQDHRSAELLKPILRGKDVQKWVPTFQNLWLLYIPWHFPVHDDPTIVGASEKAESLFKDSYPAVYQHLVKYKSELSARNKAEIGIRYEWFALQRFGSNYWRDFEEKKIIYPNMTKYLPFVYDANEHFYSNDKSFIITGDFLEYLVCFFNSKLFKYCFLDYFPELQGGTRELRKVFFEKIPVKKISKEEETPFRKIVEYIICCKRESLTESEDQFMLVYFEQIANGLIYEKYFEEEFKKHKLSIAVHISKLPDLNDKENKIRQLRKIYVSISEQEHPVSQAVFSMTTIPQIALVNGVSL